MQARCNPANLQKHLPVPTQINWRHSRLRGRCYSRDRILALTSTGAQYNPELNIISLFIYFCPCCYWLDQTNVKLLNTPNRNKIQL